MIDGFTATVGQQPLNRQPPKYRVAYRNRLEAEPSMFVAHISVEAKHFNRDEMIALARRLNKDFRREKLVSVVICDEYKTAKDHDIVYDLLRREPPPGLRGFYEIDRVSGKEGISFSTERGKPTGETYIDLTKMP